MDITEFMSLKKNPENLTLDNNILETLIDIFDKKIKKIDFKFKQVNILKGGKVQNNKDNISNKVNLILNKLSENNINNLLIEFITSINQIEYNDYNEILKTFYVKIISEINFIKIYLDFFIKIAYLYQKVLNYNITYFINIIETKFKFDYCDYNLNEDFSYLSLMNEEGKRINNLILIKHLVDKNLLSPKIINDCTTSLLSQTKYIIDIYKWIEMNNIKMNDELVTQINNIIDNKNINCRDKILLESLLNNNNEDIFKLECYNIMNKDLNDIKSFISLKCKDAITKNKFCKNLFSYYLLHNNNIFIMLDELLNNKIILKSHINKGYSLLNYPNDDITNYLSNL